MKFIQNNTIMQLGPNVVNPHHPAPSRLRQQGFFEALAFGLAHSVLVPLVMPAILCGKSLFSQIDAQPATKPAQQTAASEFAHRSRRATVQAHAAAAQSEPTSEAITAQPLASPAPIVPAYRPPNQARVTWDSRGLEIQASNSSLNQILHQVAAITGAKLEGATQDQRVFGSYGPGPGCEVTSKLLDGSGYNVVMTGCRDTDAPTAIVLSARLPANPQLAAKNQSRSNSDHVERLKPEPQPDNPSESARSQANQNPFDIGGPSHDPTQFMQEILQRQQKIDQQQQQQQQDQQNNPPQ